MAEQGEPRDRGGFAVLTAGIAGLHAYRLATTRRRPRERLAHVAMGLGMAAMFAPAAPTIPRPAAGLYLAAAIACLACGRPRDAHAVTGCLAMAYMTCFPAMRHMAGMTMSPGGASAWLGLGLVGYFIGEAAWTARSLAAAHGDRTDVACHMATGVAMAYMFLAAH
ncbi:DUF5134 domain-containing protein [Actinoallomurus sp. NPDC052308]|uniref:DUF5134 domain-containing protein n=1 Tax=Actinoallomurus sp. NPDC052308 TaxID=3155530 RepID=UPI0034199733